MNRTLPHLAQRHARAALIVTSAIVVAAVAVAAEKIYAPADEKQRPQSNKTEVLPERFLRGYDPITVYFTDNIGPAAHAPADDISRVAQLKPAWPGAWTWVDRRTLQFKPAEPWPALQRFAVDVAAGAGGGASKVLSTMMTAPLAMTPSDGADNLRPFRTLTLTFPQALPVDSLRQMLKLEIRDLPGLGDSARVIVEKPAIAELPRSDMKQPAAYAITLDDEVPEGKQLVVTLALALGDEAKSLWSGRVSTRTAFSLVDVACSGDQQSVVGKPKAPKESALDCGSQGEMPQLVFSAPPGPITLTALKRLVRLEPSVPDLHASVFGSRVQLDGKFVPDTLYKMHISASPLVDNEGRALADPGDVELYFYVGWKRPFLRFKEGQSMLEQNGPRMIPLVGYGEPQADVRIYRIDALHPGLWPFPSTPVVVNEETPPPFPGEEPEMPEPGFYVTADKLNAHLRMLGSPLVSKVLPLPLLDKSGTTTFGLDIGPALDAVVGAHKPGTYLVGVRRLQGGPERNYVRIQITNLSVTTAEERGRAVFFVNTLDGAQPVENAKITFEVRLDPQAAKNKKTDFATFSITTDGSGRANLDAHPEWRLIQRIVVEKGDDVLVFDPKDPPPQFMNNHWSSASGWLAHLTAPVPPPVNDRELGFLFTERPIYRPGEKVFLKGYIRDKKGGVLTMPPVKRADGKDIVYAMKIVGPGNQEWTPATKKSALSAFEAVFTDANPPTGRYTAHLMADNKPIASRTFQIEAYRIPQFEVQLAGPAKARLDAPFKVKAVARYYAGGNVAHEKIHWSVTRRPWHHVPKGREGFLFASSTQFARPEAKQADERTEKSGELADDGSDEIEVNPALDLDGSPRVYRFEATVTGADNQEVSSVTEVEALPPFTLGMKLPRYSKKPLTLEPEIIAVGVDDKLLAGQKVTARLYKRTWHSHLRESQFATGQASYVTEQEDTKLAEIEVTTSSADSIKAKLPVAEAGVYVVELTARDKLGRVQTLSADLYVGGKEPVAWQKGQAGVFELVPDKEKYQPGDTANIVVKSPFTKAKALVIVEEPQANRYAFVDVEGGQATVHVPVGVEHVPNLPVHVVLMRGRLGDGGSDDAAYRPQTMGASLDLQVEPVKNKVKIDVKHPESARPGSTINVDITLKDDRGAPLGGEVTLWLVDEAVLSLASEGTLDPLTSMIVQNQRATSVTDTRNKVVGRVLEEETPGGDGGEGMGEGKEGVGIAHRRVRKNFETVPYYQATLIVPASGKLSVPVKLSDDLTNFMVRAVVVSGADRFGNWESKLKVRLPVLVQPQLPRFVRIGDKFEGGGVARVVEGSDGAGVLKMEMHGPVDDAKRSKDIELKQSKAASVTFPIEVKEVPGVDALKVKVDVYRKSDGVGDAFEVDIPVLPDRQFEKSASLETWAAGQHAFPPLPEAARPGSVRREVVATTAKGLLEAVAGLEYVTEYPHGCLEQKMSALSPQLTLLSLGNAFADGLGINEGGIRKNVQRLLTEFPQHQADDGLYGFWPGTSGSVQVTSDALLFAAQAESVGLKIDETSKQRAIEALKRVLRSDYPAFITGWRYNEQSAALRGLYAVGQYDEHYITDLFRTRKDMDLTARTELALAMWKLRSTFAKDLDVAKKEAWSSIVFNLDHGKRVFAGLSDPRSDWGGLMYGSPTSTLAEVLQELVLLDGSNPDLPIVFDALLQRASAGYGFGSTYDNRRAIEAIVSYLAVAKPGNIDSKIVFAANGKDVVTMNVDDAHKVVRTHIDGTAPLVATVTGHDVQVRLMRSYLPREPGYNIAALKNGFIVQRAMTIIPADGSSPKRVDDVKGAERTLKVGDVVEMHVTMTTDQARANVALRVPFAAGFEPLNPELKTSSSEAQPSEHDSIEATYVQRLDDEERFYFTSLPAGTYSFHFRVKATTPGSYVEPPAIAEMMYREEVRGRSDGLRVIITPGKEQE